MTKNIISRKSAIKEGYLTYFTGKPCKRSHVAERYVSSYACVACLKELESSSDFRIKKRERSALYRSENREQYNSYLREWARKNSDRKKIISSRWRSRNKEESRRLTAAWAKNNKHLRNASSAKRRAYKLQATPSWSDLDLIKLYYTMCPEGFHVDHIVPLQGENVCGLHVLWNLQFLPAEENLRKGNRHAE